MLSKQFSSRRWAVLTSSATLAALSVSVVAPIVEAQQADRYQVAIERALAEFQSGHYEEARAFFRQAHRESPNPRTLRGIAMASYELRDYAEAYRSLRSALSFGPSDRDLTAEQRNAATDLFDRTRALLGVVTGVPRDGSATVDGAAARIEDDGAILLGLGHHAIHVTFADGRTSDLAVDVAGGDSFELRQPAAIVAAPTGNPDTLRAAGRAAYEAQRFDEAASAYEQAVRLAPTDAALWAALGVTRIALRAWAPAADAFTHAVQLSPSTAGYHAGLGRALYEQGDSTAARGEFEAALAIDPQNQDARIGLERTAAETGGAGGPEPVGPEPVAVEDVDAGPRFRLQFFGTGGVGAFSGGGSQHVAAGGGAGAAGLVQLGSVYAIGLQASARYASLAEVDSFADTPYWLQTDVLVWNEARFGALGLDLGLGLALGVQEKSAFESDGFRTFQTAVTPAFGLAAGARVYFLDDLLFVGAETRLAFGDYSAASGFLLFGLEPVR